MKVLYPVVLVASLTACHSADKKADTSTATTSSTPANLPATLEDAVGSGTYRTAANVKRDMARHPLETLKFFGVQPDMTVVEIWPGAGWYMEILGPYLAAKGNYIAAVPPATNDEGKTRAMGVSQWLRSHPEVKVTQTTLAPPAHTEIAPTGSADMVLTFRNVHNWMMNKNEQAVFNSFFKALKPGGILGVVEHRGDPKKTQSHQSKGYVREDVIIKIAKKAGFQLLERSEINANPRDTKNYAEGVWTLPPSLALGDKDYDKYAAIGESDRMTLKFVKPLKK
jgi:predicted methyltransferase